MLFLLTSFSHYMFIQKIYSIDRLNKWWKKSLFNLYFHENLKKFRHISTHWSFVNQFILENKNIVCWEIDIWKSVQFSLIEFHIQPKRLFNFTLAFIWLHWIDMNWFLKKHRISDNYLDNSQLKVSTRAIQVEWISGN